MSKDTYKQLKESFIKCIVEELEKDNSFYDFLLKHKDNNNSNLTIEREKPFFMKDETTIQKQKENEVQHDEEIKEYENAKEQLDSCLEKIKEIEEENQKIYNQMQSTTDKEEKTKLFNRLDELCDLQDENEEKIKNLNNVIENFENKNIN